MPDYPEEQQNKEFNIINTLSAMGIAGGRRHRFLYCVIE